MLKLRKKKNSMMLALLPSFPFKWFLAQETKKLSLGARGSWLLQLGMRSAEKRTDNEGFH